MPDPVPPVARRLGWLHFWNDFTLDFLTPLLPTGVGAAWIGVMEGIADGVGQALRLVSGRASDRSGRRVPWVAAGYGANAVFRPLAAVGMLLAWPWWVVCCRIGDRLGKGLRGSASDALIADWVAPAQRPWVYGLMRICDHAGATAGALAAAGAAWFVVECLHADLGWAVLALVLPMLAMLLLLRGLRDRPEAALRPAVPRAGWWPRSPAVRWPLAVVAVASLGAKVSPLLILVLASGWVGDGRQAWEPWQLCLAWAALGVVQTLAASGAAWCADRLGARRFLIAGWTAGAAVFAALACADGPWLAIAGLAWGVMAGLTEGAEKAWIASLAAVEERATTFGALALLVAGAALIGSAGCGFGLEHCGAWILVVPALALALGALGVVLIGSGEITSDTAVGAGR